MPKTLSTEHKAKLAEARSDAAAAKQNADDINAREWLDWLAHETAAYFALLSARHLDAPQAEIDAAYKEWREWSSIQPRIPNNASLRRVRGDNDDESND